MTYEHIYEHSHEWENGKCALCGAANHNMNPADDYFFKKYYTWRGEARIARVPSSAQVVADDIRARLKRDDESEWIYSLTLVQAWEDGCRSDCVGTCTCEHREFPYPALVRDLRAKLRK